MRRRTKRATMRATKRLMPQTTSAMIQVAASMTAKTIDTNSCRQTIRSQHFAKCLAAYALAEIPKNSRYQSRFEALTKTYVSPFERSSSNSYPLQLKPRICSGA